MRESYVSCVSSAPKRLAEQVRYAASSLVWTQERDNDLTLAAKLTFEPFADLNQWKIIA
jgi:hypothetical protein